MLKTIMLISALVFIIFLIFIIIHVVNLMNLRKDIDTVVMPFTSFEKIYKLAEEKWNLQYYYAERAVRNTSDKWYKDLYGDYHYKWVHVTFNFFDFWKYRKFCLCEKIKKRKRDKFERNFQNNLAYKLLLETVQEEIEAMREEARKDYEAACDILKRSGTNERIKID